MADPLAVASAEYQTFIESRAKTDDVTLVEIHPREELTGWTAVVGLTNAYSTPFHPFFAEDKTAGGIYRRMIGIADNAVSLTAHDYVGPVESATGGSQGAWYYHNGRGVTNIATYSEEFDKSGASGGWVKGRTTVAPAGVNSLAPDLTLTVDLITEDVDTATTYLVYKADLTVDASDGGWTFSVHCQAAPVPQWGIKLVIKEFGDTSAVGAWFNIDSDPEVSAIGTTEEVSGGTLLDSTINTIDLTEYSGGYWHRCSVSGTLPVGTTHIRAQVFLADQDNNVTYDGDGSSSIYLWGGQIEAMPNLGKYVRTQASTVTVPTNSAVANTTTFGQNPDLTDMMAAKFRLHFATAPEIFDSIYYEPRVVGDSLPDVHMEAEDLFFGPVKKVAEGEFALNNADGVFDEVSKTWAWKNAEVKLYFGGDDLVHTHVVGITDQYANIGTFYCEDISPGLEEASIVMRGGQKSTWRYLPPRVFNVDLYPDMDSSSFGKPIPLLYGKKDGIAPSFAGGTQTKVYVIADPLYQTLYSIGSVYNDGIEIPASYITDNLSDCEFEISEDFGDVGSITCDAIGQVDGLGAWETSTDYLKYYGEIIGDIYTTYLGFPSASINSTQAVACDATEPTPQSMYINEAKTARAYIRELEIGVMGRTVEGLDGSITPTVWFAGVGVTTTTIASIIEEDIVEFEPDTRLEALFSEITVLGDRDPADSGFRISETETSNKVKYLQLDGATMPKTMETALVRKADTKSLAGRVRFVSEDMATNVRIIESSGQLFTADIGDKVKVTCERAPDIGGTWDAKVLEIVSITKSFAPQPLVEIVVNDRSDMSTVWATWQADTMTYWPSGSGWWSDPDGYASIGIPGSLNVSRWG